MFSWCLIRINLTLAPITKKNNLVLHSSAPTYPTISCAMVINNILYQKIVIFFFFLSTHIILEKIFNSFNLIFTKSDCNKFSLKHCGLHHTAKVHYVSTSNCGHLKYYYIKWFYCALNKKARVWDVFVEPSFKIINYWINADISGYPLHRCCKCACNKGLCVTANINSIKASCLGVFFFFHLTR